MEVYQAAMVFELQPCPWCLHVICSQPLKQNAVRNSSTTSVWLTAGGTVAAASCTQGAGEGLRPVVPPLTCAFSSLSKHQKIRVAVGPSAGKATVMWPWSSLIERNGFSHSPPKGNGSANLSGQCCCSSARWRMKGFFKQQKHKYRTEIMREPSWGRWETQELDTQWDTSPPHGADVYRCVHVSCLFGFITRSGDRPPASVAPLPTTPIHCLWWRGRMKRWSSAGVDAELVWMNNSLVWKGQRKVTLQAMRCFPVLQY